MKIPIFSMKPARLLVIPVDSQKEMGDLFRFLPLQMLSHRGRCRYAVFAGFDAVDAFAPRAMFDAFGGFADSATMRRMPSGEEATAASAWLRLLTKTCGN